MHKLVKEEDKVPEPPVPRIYRLRTNDEKYEIRWECRCNSWTENQDQYEAHFNVTWDSEREDVIWTIEWLDETEEVEPIITEGMATNE